MFSVSGVRKIRLSSFLKDVLFTSVTSAVQLLLFLVTMRLLAQYLGPEKFGAYALSRRLVATIAAAATLAMDVAIARFIAYQGPGRTRQAYLLAGTILGTLPSVLVLLLGVAFPRQFARFFFQSRAYAPLLIATLLMVVAYCVYNVFYALCRGSGQMGKANLWQLGAGGVGPLLVALVSARLRQPEIVVLLMAACLFASAVPLASECLVALRQPKPGQGVCGALRDLAAYGVPRVPGAFAFAGLFMIGPFLASYFGFLKEAGYLVAAQSLMRVAETGLVSFGLVALPKVSQMLANGKHDAISQHISDLVGLMFHLGIYAALHLLIWADYVVFLALGNGYQPVVLLTRILSISLPPYLFYIMLRAIIDAIELRAVHTFNLFRSCLITLALSCVSIKLGLGTTGVCMAMAAGLSALGLFTLRYLWRTHSITTHFMLRQGLATNIALFGCVLAAKHLLELTPWFQGLALLPIAAILEGMSFLTFFVVLRRLRTPALLTFERRIFASD